MIIMIKSSFNRRKIKRKQKERSPGTYPSRLEILLKKMIIIKGGMNKIDIDGVKTKVLIFYY